MTLEMALLLGTGLKNVWQMGMKAGVGPSYRGIMGGGVMAAFGRGAGHTISGVGHLFGSEGTRKFGAGVVKSFDDGVMSKLLKGAKGGDPRDIAVTVTEGEKTRTVLVKAADRAKLGFAGEMQNVAGEAVTGGAGTEQAIGNFLKNGSPHINAKAARGALRQASKDFGDVDTVAVRLADGTVGRVSTYALTSSHRAIVTNANIKMMRGFATSAAVAWAVGKATEKTWETSTRMALTLAGFANNIGTYETAKMIPMLNTMQARSEREGSLRYIRQSRTNARSALGLEASLVHGT